MTVQGRMVGRPACTSLPLYKMWTTGEVTLCWTIAPTSGIIEPYFESSCRDNDIGVRCSTPSILR